MTPDRDARAREIVEACRAKHSARLFTGRPYACDQCIAAALAERAAALAEARRDRDALRTMLLRAMEAEDPDEWTMDAQALVAALPPQEREGETR